MGAASLPCAEQDSAHYLVLVGPLGLDSFKCCLERRLFQEPEMARVAGRNTSEAYYQSLVSRWHPNATLTPFSSRLKQRQLNQLAGSGP
jgi:hypothetical protein